MSVTVKSPEIVWPKTLIWSLVPETVIVRVAPLRVKLTLTLPEIETPAIPPPREIWPLKLPLVIWKLVSVSVADAPVTRTRPLPIETLRLLSWRLPLPVLEMLPTIVPERLTGPKVSLKLVLIPALIVNWPLPKVTVTLAGPMPPVRAPENPVGATTRLPLTLTGPDEPATIMLATATLMVPVVESRLKVRSPVRVWPAMVRLMPVPLTVTVVAVRVRLTLPESWKPLAAAPTLTLPLAEPVTTVLPPAPVAAVKLAVPPVT